MIEVAVAAFFVSLLFAVFIAKADAREVRWQKAGATLYGGPTDASSGCIGYRSDNLCGPGMWRTWAELGMGCSVGSGALGGLPYRAKIRVLYRHRKLTVVKRDCGLGGGAIGWYPRAIDLWWRAAAYLRFPGYGVVQWRRVR